MGKANRQRRADKRRRQQRHQGGPGPGSGGQQGGAGPSIDEWLVAGAHLAADGRIEAMDQTLLSLSSSPREAVDASIVRRVESALQYIWEGGWLPAELVGAARRKISARHGELAASAVVFDGRRLGGIRQPPVEWADQLAEVGLSLGWEVSQSGWWPQWCARSGRDRLDALRTAIELLGLLISLPVLQRLVPPPSGWGAGRSSARASRPADDPVLERVRALLAKAESTSFPEEADALTAKAQELMARHAIDTAMLEGASGGGDGPQARRFWLDNPYAPAKAELLAVVGATNRSRCVWDGDWNFMTVVAHEGDLDAIDMLFTSLLVQATRAMLAKGRHEDRFGRSRTRSFRQSFLVAFAGRIHERLVAAAAAAQRDATQEHGGMLLPVLAGRTHAVDDRVAELFPRLGRFTGPSATNREGWMAGRVAAEMATLGPRSRELFAG
jgi:hypothetical protein